MAQRQHVQVPSPHEAHGGGGPDVPENWGNGGLVGRYRLIRRLGHGGMAEVFAAEDVRLGRTVAVKLLRPELAADPTSTARFTREAQSVGSLNHHGVVAVYDSGEEIVDQIPVPYIVMELIEGKTVRDLLLATDAPNPEQALFIISGVLEALNYSHHQGIVHRDIKPANVIVTDSGVVKVMDFGIARALSDAQSRMTQTGMVVGTPDYLSPEQALGKVVDQRSDLYSTGCLLYQLLTGRPPFVGDSPLSLIYQQVQDTPAFPSQASTNVPPELDGLVMRALAKDPNERFQTALEMRQSVQYGLAMLREQGSHVGTWNTGLVHQGTHHPSADDFAEPIATGTATPPAHHTWILPAAGSPGQRHRSASTRRSARGHLLMPTLLALLIVIAIAAGIAFAITNGGSGWDGKSTNDRPASTDQLERTGPHSLEPTAGASSKDGAESAGVSSQEPPAAPTAPHREISTRTPSGSSNSSQSAEPSRVSSGPVDEPLPGTDGPHETASPTNGDNSSASPEAPSASVSPTDDGKDSDGFFD